MSGRLEATQRAYIGLGANLGDARATLVVACDALARLPGCRWVACSSLYRSAPVDAGGPDFLNAVVALECLADAGPGPLQLLAALHEIESGHGRLRPYLNAPRTLDLDLLLHGDLAIATAALTLPHPRMHLRAFVLRPLVELAPDLAFAGVGRWCDVLAALPDQDVERVEPPGWSGPPAFNR